MLCRGHKHDCGRHGSTSGADAATAQKAWQRGWRKSSRAWCKPMSHTVVKHTSAHHTCFHDSAAWTLLHVALHLIDILFRIHINSFVCMCNHIMNDLLCFQPYTVHSCIRSYSVPYCPYIHFIQSTVRLRLSLLYRLYLFMPCIFTVIKNVPPIL